MICPYNIRLNCVNSLGLKWMNTIKSAQGTFCNWKMHWKSLNCFWKFTIINFPPSNGNLISHASNKTKFGCHSFPVYWKPNKTRIMQEIFFKTNIAFICNMFKDSWITKQEMSFLISQCFSSRELSGSQEAFFPSPYFHFCSYWTNKGYFYFYLKY